MDAVGAWRLREQVSLSQVLLKLNVGEGRNQVIPIQ
jgi:hypothetical protein